MNDEVNESTNQVEEELPKSDKQEAETSSLGTGDSKLFDSEEDSDKKSIDFLGNVPMKLTVELGMGDISIRDLLQLGQGSVLELEKLAGEPLEVKVNDRLISKGEVVVINDRYGIRLTDVMSQEEMTS